MRRLCAAVLTMEALVILLAIPVAVQVGHDSGARAGLAGGVLAIACLLVAGLLRIGRPAYIAGSILQILVIASGLAVSTMYVLGIIFAALWITAIWLARRTAGAQSR